MRSGGTYLVVTTLLVCFAVVALCPKVEALPTTLVSLSGREAFDESVFPAVSADGRYVAFESAAANLVPGDLNTMRDVFVYDCVTGQTERVSVASDGSEGNSDSLLPHISADGRYVAFESWAFNLVADDWNSAKDIFVHDRQTGQTERVSVASDGMQGFGDSLGPKLSADGRYVTFTSYSNNFVPDDANGVTDIFVHDRQTDQTERVSVSSAGVEGDQECLGSALSGDGRYVAFSSAATNLVADDTNGFLDIFVHDRQTDETERVSLASGGTEGDGHSFMPAVSANGRYVAFTSNASSLVPGDANGRPDTFVHDRVTAETVRVSVASDGTEGNGSGCVPAFSADGRYVGFNSDSSNLVGDDANGWVDVFVHDCVTGQTERVSLADGGTEGNGNSCMPALSSDGRYVALLSGATNLAPGDSNARADIFLRDRQTGETERVSLSSYAMQGNNSSVLSAPSADGRYVAFLSVASNLVPGDTNAVNDVFVRDLETGDTERVSVASDGTQANDWSNSPGISEGGRHVVYSSRASTLVPSDTNGNYDIFLRDRETGQTERVSIADGGAQSNGDSLAASVSGDGRYVAFESNATNLVVGDTNGDWDVLLRDRVTEETTRVSVASGGAQGDGVSYGPAISADGRYVAFASVATNLVVGDTNLTTDVFVHDCVTGETERVSVDSDGAEGNDFSDHPAISADGRCVAFRSNATNLVAGDTNATRDIFVHDRVTGETERVSVASDGTEANDQSDAPALSSDGRHVVFHSGATTLVAGDTNGEWDAFLHDHVTGKTERVSVASNGAQGDSSSGEPALSGDGRYVTFFSNATNLVAGDANGQADVFVRERPAASFSGTPTNGAFPLPVTFSDLSTGGATGWDWDFGDGYGSTDQHPSHLYGSVGSYTVTLTVTDGVGWDTETKLDYITVRLPAPPVADFSALPTSGVVPLDVGFTDLSTNTPTAWSWSFGDSGTSTAQHPSHQYASVGQFTVSLTATNADGSDSETKNNCIETALPAPVADFSATPTSGRAPLEVTFTDLSTNTPTAWAWAFGDTSTSTAQHPSHGYARAGRYTVSLTAASAGGSDTETKADYITVSFSDVPIAPEDPSDHWALDYILACVEAGIVGGYPDGSYHPSEAVARDQMAVFISRGLAGGDSGVPSGPLTATFSDVPTDHWAYKYVEYAVDNGVTGGYPDGTYRPAVIVTRDQMAVFMARAMCGGDASVPTGPATACFPDVPTTHWAFRYVEYIRGEGVTGGYPDGTYRPVEACTRDQMAVYVQRAFHLPM